MVRALEGRTVAAPLRDERAAVAADVQQRVQLAGAVAGDHDRHVADAAGEEVAGLRGMLGGASVLPAAAEDPLLLPSQQLRVGVPAPRKRALRCPGGQIPRDYRRRRHLGTFAL